jgi:hypothetical protein
MSESFGTRLRLQRERQQIALTLIAEETKISLALLEELERDDLSHWPAGIFRRAFIRDYARIVGLDPDAVVREFLKLYPGRIEDIAPAQPGEGEKTATAPPTRLRYLVGSAIDAFRRLQLGQEQPPAPVEGVAARPRVHVGTEAPPDGMVNSAVDTGAADSVQHQSADSAVQPVAAASVVRDADSAVHEPPSDHRNNLLHETVGAALTAGAPAAPPPILALDGTESDRPRARRHSVARDVKSGSRPQKRRQTRTDEPALINEQDTRDGADAATGSALSFEKPVAQQDTDLAAVAQVCTDLARIADSSELGPLLGRAATIVDAAGIIVWVWNPRAGGLTPAFAHGYSNDALARLSVVRPDAENATAACFRSAEPRSVTGTERTNGALVIPLLIPSGCGGVLAVELLRGGEQRLSTRALLTILAAQLATLLGAVPVAEAVNT